MTYYYYDIILKELRGDGLKSFNQAKEKEKSDKLIKSEKDYCSFNDEVSVNMADAIKMGLKNKKILKKGLVEEKVEEDVEEISKVNRISTLLL